MRRKRVTATVSATGYSQGLCRFDSGPPQLPTRRRVPPGGMAERMNDMAVVIMEADELREELTDAQRYIQSLEREIVDLRNLLREESPFKSLVRESTNTLGKRW